MPPPPTAAVDGVPGAEDPADDVEPAGVGVAAAAEEDAAGRAGVVETGVPLAVEVPAIPPGTVCMYLFQRASNCGC